LDPEGFPHTRRLANNSAKPLCTIENVEHLLNSYGIIAQYDVIGKEIQITIPGQHGVTENSANTAIERINSLASLNGLPTAQVPRYVAVIADENPINRAADWMCSKKWDGIDRIDAICDTLVTQEGFPKAFKKTLVTKWLRSVVAAATTPHGFHTRGVLTLQGPQLIGKSSWNRNLMPPGLLRDRSILTGHQLDPGNKDSLTTAIKHLIVEIGELDSSFKRDIARLKGFLTQDRDSVRRPYARTNAEYQRRTVFAATVNEISFLIDKTGNSRFWVIPVTSIDYNHGIDTQQLFAQLKRELDAGATWWLKPKEDARLEELNRDHRAVSVVEEKLLEAFNFDLPADRWSNLSATEVLEWIGYQRPTNSLCRECGGILREHVGQPKKSHGIAKWKVPLDSRKARSL
jgi:putative DNA primase/helicase